jgi:DNA polymerase-3 subunit epsilon
MQTELLADRPSAAGGDGTRVLHRLDVRTGPTGEGDGRGRHVGIALDVETTGLNADQDVIIELAVRRFRYDDDGVITNIDKPYAWLEDPGRGLEPHISALTGLVDRDLVGREIDEGAATDLLRSASLVIAHHSRFDRIWIENRLEVARGLSWACSMEQVDWRAHAGFDGRSLGWLLMQAGFYHDGHRAGADVDAVIQLLRHRSAEGRTTMSVMVENAAKPGWIIRAKGADFSVKDLLKARGYRWSAERRVWWREVGDDDRLGEEFWLAANIYDVAANPKALGPEFVRVTARERFL